MPELQHSVALWRRLASGVVALGFVVVSVAAQPGLVSFDVASVKPNLGRVKDAPPSLTMHPNGLTAINWRLKSWIALAYDVTRIEKLPSWASEARFDVRAKASGPFSRAQQRAMLRALLSERFNLKVHVEGRMTDVYLLTRLEGAPLGRGLHRITIDCNTNILAQDSARGVFPNGARPRCGQSLVGITPYRGSMDARHAGMTLASFATTLQGALQRPVIDATNLDGTFDIEITYKNDAILRYVSEKGRAAAEAAPGPSIRDALKEQLGLTVVPSRQMIDFLVVDSIERLTPD